MRRERIAKEIALMRGSFPDLELREDPSGEWVRLPNYALPGGWSKAATDVAFQILPAFPGQPPYGFYVPAGVQFNGNRPDNYTEPSAVQPPFGGSWGHFSWQSVDGQWRATTQPDPARGYTLLAWVKGFALRFAEGR